jgi:hypothetical protein
MDDNIWEYPFGDIDDDEDIFFQKPVSTEKRSNISKGDSINIEYALFNCIFY